MLTFWFRICQAAIWLYFKLRIYRAWSSLYRFIYERKYKDVKLPEYKTLREIVAFTKTLTWTADTFRELFDATSTPEKVQYIGTEGNKLVGDCDEFAIYNAVSINNAIERGEMKECASAKIMAVMWMDPFGKTNGHNVALIEMADHNAFTYMDYNVPSIYSMNVLDVANAVIHQYSMGSRLLGYAVSDPRTLKLETIKLS
jgi:hypothetical protein